MLALLLKSNDHLKREYDFLAANILAEKTLRLKIGTQVMCIVNLTLCGELQIANGSQGIIVGFNEHNLPYVKFNNSKDHILIDYYIWKSETNKSVGLSQIPLIYSWAITIHKAQGSTLDLALIDIGSTIFEYGQAYVALSRVKSLDSLYIWDLNPNAFRVHPKVKTYLDTLNNPETSAS
jgi:ATP-dependent DNA helicase PIF1